MNNGPDRDLGAVTVNSLTFGEFAVCLQFVLYSLDMVVKHQRIQIIFKYELNFYSSLATFFESRE